MAAEGGGSLMRLGGASGIAIGLGYVAIIALYIPIGVRPRGAAAWLAAIGGHDAQWWAILWLSVATDLLFLLFAAALHRLIRPHRPTLATIAAGATALFAVLDLAITWPNYAALITLAGDADPVTASTAAIYPATIADSLYVFVANTLTLSVGMLAAGLGMRGPHFRAAYAWLGIAGGGAGILAVFGPLVLNALSPLIFLASLLTLVWAAALGWLMLRR